MVNEGGALVRAKNQNKKFIPSEEVVKLSLDSYGKGDTFVKLELNLFFHSLIFAQTLHDRVNSVFSFFIFRQPQCLSDDSQTVFRQSVLYVILNQLICYFLWLPLVFQLTLLAWAFSLSLRVFFNVEEIFQIIPCKFLANTARLGKYVSFCLENCLYRQGPGDSKVRRVQGQLSS